MNAQALVICRLGPAPRFLESLRSFFFLHPPENPLRAGRKTKIAACLTSEKDSSSIFAEEGPTVPIFQIKNFLGLSTYQPCRVGSLKQVVRLR